MPRMTGRRIASLAIAVGVLFDVVGPGNAAGINVLLVTAALLLAAFVAAGRDGLRRMDPADAWLAPAALLIAAMAAVRTDDWLVATDIGLAWLLVTGAIAVLAGARITRGLVTHVLEMAMGLVVTCMIGVLVRLGLSRTAAAAAGANAPTTAAADPSLGPPPPPPTLPSPPAGPSRLRRALPVLRGLAIAVPVLGVFVGLFASADAVFAKMAGDILAWSPDFDPSDIIRRSLIVTTVAWVVAGLVAMAAGQLPGLVPTPTAPVPIAESPGRRGLLGTTEAVTVLGAVDLLFAAFVALQVAYLFGGRDTLSAAGLTYADYARRGFFELVAVAVLAGMVVVGLDAAVGRRTRAQLAASVALLALTAVVLGSAVVRLRLYQEAYGWTELRFVVAVAIGWLAVALVVVGGLLLTRRTGWTLHVLGILTLVTVAGVNVIGPQAFVADRNLERVLDPSQVASGGQTGLDSDYLQHLGDEAVPAVVASFERMPAPDRVTLASFLEARTAALRTDPSYLGWPSWNLSREQARQALGAWATSESK